MGTERFIRIPEDVEHDPSAEEVLRVWSSGERQTFSARVEHWDDPAAWGLLLADLAQHVARSYAEHGAYSEGDATDRVLAGLRAELDL